MSEHPYQLRRIELQHFKSVGSASVALQPLTVVVGANSSGKSTLLQAILAVTQAARAGGGTGEFPLNGEFVRLGTFDETRNFIAATDDNPLEISFDLVEPHDLRWTISATEEDDSKTQMTWHAYINDSASGSNSGASSSSGFAHLASVQIEVGKLEPTGDLTRLLSCDISDFSPPHEESPNLSFVRGRARLLGTGARMSLASGRIQDWESGESGRVDATVLRGGVPQLLLRRTRLFDWVAEVWWNVAEDLLQAEIEETKREKVGETRKRPTLAAVKQATTNIEALPSLATSTPTSESVSQGVDTWSEALDRMFVRELAQLSDKEKMSVAKSMTELGEVKFRDRLYEHLKIHPRIEEEVFVEHSGSAGQTLWRWGVVTDRFFRSSVRYLGPLREAPHVLYDPGPSKLDLGVRGEYAAGVLHAQVHKRIQMPTPEGDGEMQELGTALNFWLGEFGLADEAKSEDRGRIGIGLSVRPKGISRDVDLTSVGVGVSQVLPVILLCLLAEPGTLLILEQPELHLHPKLQQDLADFLLACARSGRQLIVESHSEHLVNRLRYRIAEDTTDETHDLIGLVFAENEDGITTYREPDINPYGGLGDDWPAGFLDVTAKQSQELVQQSLAKRKQESSFKKS